jgi:hypothetical protein
MTPDDFATAYERALGMRWIHSDAHMVVGLFDYSWKGVINGKTGGGVGRGTHVLVNESGRWLLLAEHLGPRPA